MHPSKTNPATLWTDAKHMRVAADVLVDTLDAADKKGDTTRVKQLVHPIMLLIGSSIEAGFKSYLNHKGVTLQQLASLKHFGHDLHKLQQEVLKHADAALVKIVNEVTPIIDLLNPHYLEKHFNYREIGLATYPLPAPVCKWIKAYLAEIKPRVLK